jgi:hypothetical protein
MFGVVHAVLLTLLTFGLVAWFPSFTHFSYSLLGCIILPFLSLSIGIGCTWCVLYITEERTEWIEAIRRGWIPSIGIFSSSLFLLPLEMMQSDTVGPLNILIATSIVVNGLVAWILQVYALRSSASASASAGSGPI